MNSDLKKYMRDCRILFPSYGKDEKEFMKRMISNIDDNHLKYDQLVERLGTPSEVVSSYFGEKDDLYLIKRAKISKYIKAFLVLCTLILSSFLLYRSYIIQLSYEEVKNSSNGYFETTIE